MTSAYPLEQLFLALRHRGIALSVRDYRDALTAIQAGFGAGSRAELRALLDALWARSEAESRILALLFSEIPSPSQEEISNYDRARTTQPSAPASPASRSAPSHPSAAPEPQVAVSFREPDQSGLDIPQPVFSQSPGESFILTPQPPVTLRSLIVAWRRFQMRQRIGPGRELDIPASIDRQCRTGRLLSPVLKAERANQARLLLFIDSSSSMAAWSSLWPLWQESISNGRLGAACIYYFSNVPGDTLYLHPALRDPVDCAAAFLTISKPGILIFSDAGAARGSRNRDRVEQTKQFLNRVRVESTSIVWLNPLPPSRWRGTSAQAIARQSHLPMLPLTEPDLVRAVDLLRGIRPR